MHDINVRLMNLFFKLSGLNNYYAILIAISRNILSAVAPSNTYRLGWVFGEPLPRVEPLVIVNCIVNTLNTLKYTAHAVAKFCFH